MRRTTKLRRASWPFLVSLMHQLGRCPGYLYCELPTLVSCSNVGIMYKIRAQLVGSLELEYQRRSTTKPSSSPVGSSFLRGTATCKSQVAQRKCVAAFGKGRNFVADLANLSGIIFHFVDHIVDLDNVDRGSSLRRPPDVGVVTVERRRVLPFERTRALAAALTRYSTCSVQAECSCRCRLSYLRLSSCNFTRFFHT